jgi:hypothetical protein
MATRVQVTVDCADPERMVRFWATALGYPPEPPPEGYDEWATFWRGLGLPEEEVVDSGESVVDPDGVGPTTSPSSCGTRRATSSASTERRTASRGLTCRP